MLTRDETYTLRGGGTTKKLFVALFVVLLAIAALSVALASPAQAKLQSAGPVNPSNGFPFWYQDESGTRLDLCLPPDPNQKCLQPFEMPNPDQPLSFPDNFPGEAFWWSGEADLSDQMPNSNKALLVLAQEAAFSNDEPKDGDQMSFGRIRIRVDGLQIGQKYRVTHPYGVDEFVAQDDGKGRGEINVTEDIGCFPTPRTPCNFDEANSSRLGPFLTWDTFGGANNDPALRGANGEPNAYVGDPNITHAVKGSPLGTNIFKVERLNADGTVAAQLGSTNQFAISGKVSRAQVGISPAETLFNADQDVTMSSSDSSVGIRYTMADAVGTTAPTPPADPTGASTLYSGPVKLTADPETQKTYTIKAAPFDSAGNQRGEVVTKTYTIDKVAPHLTADPPSKVSETPLDVALSANDPGAKIYYTLDGSTAPTEAIDAGDPAASKIFLYSGPIHVGRSTTIHAIAVDAAGNKSRVETFSYQIASLKQTGPIDPSNGFPSWYEDANGTRLDLCLNPQDQKCLQPFEMPDPTAQSVSFPDNFPAEAFWWSGEAQTTTTNGSDALLVLAQEATFANDEPKDGDQMSFGRVRVRVDGLVAGEKYKVTHPYGVDEFVADPVVDGSTVGEINYTEDIGCFPTPRTPCDFDDARFSRIGPFLTWDTFGGANNDPALRGANGEPNAYVGDPNITHAVKGSPYGTNIFKVEHLNADGTATQVASTDQFAISGKVSNPANQPPTAPTGLALAAGSNSGDPADSLTNDTTPTINGTAEAGVSVDILADGTAVGSGTAAADGSFSITTSVLGEGNHSITAVAKKGNLASAQSGSISLTIDTTRPVVSASPAPGTYQSAQSVTLSTGNAADKIYYTTNGSQPTTSSTLYSAPISVANTQTIRAIAVDKAGNQSASAPFAYTINITRTAPGTPTIGTATAGNASATVNWTKPNDGGSAITGYEVQVRNVNTGANVSPLRTAGANATQLNITGLTNGTRYQFRVRAVNAVGTGAYSAFSTTVTPTTTPPPQGGLPGAPTIGTAVNGVAGGTVSATAKWSPPTNNGGSAITGYLVTAVRVNQSGAPHPTGQTATMTAGANATSKEMTTANLTSGTLVSGAFYKFKVQASNTPTGAKQYGPASALSNQVTAR